MPFTITKQNFIKSLYAKRIDENLLMHLSKVNVASFNNSADGEMQYNKIMYSAQKFTEMNKFENRPRNHRVNHYRTVCTIPATGKQYAVFHIFALRMSNSFWLVGDPRFGYNRFIEHKFKLDPVYVDNYITRKNIQNDIAEAKFEFKHTENMYAAMCNLFKKRIDHQMETVNEEIAARERGDNDTEMV